MKKIKCGDIVGRKSYNKDIIFLVKDVSDKNNILLEGIFERIIADSSIDDLEIIKEGAVAFRNATALCFIAEKYWFYYNII